MGDKDFTVGAVGIPQVGAISKKPSYLVTLEDVSGKSKTKGIRHFITFDKPDLLVGFIQVKGVYSDLDEAEIASDFASILAGTPKENILDIMFPVHKICSIRSLVFNANKPASLVK